MLQPPSSGWWSRSCGRCLPPLLCGVAGWPGSPDFEVALQHLQVVFTAIRRAGLRLNPKKCHLLRSETVFLGHVVSAAGVTTDPAKVAVVKKWPVPKNIAELRSFLGVMSVRSVRVGHEPGWWRHFRECMCWFWAVVHVKLPRYNGYVPPEPYFVAFFVDFWHWVGPVSM